MEEVERKNHVSKPDDAQAAVPGNAGYMCSPTIRSRCCVVVGSTTLAIFCAEQIRAAGHEISFVVATDDVFERWAAQEGIRILDSIAVLEEEVVEHPIDWLFSVINPIILPASLIELVRERAFNYHDSPLPRYAGTYATTWALLAQERDYAVTWHTITASVDAGEIAIQEPVAIGPSDTALSLNLKCYQSGQKGFSKLLGQLNQDNLVTWKQDNSHRSFYRRTRRPEAGAFLDWTKPAEELSAIVRALDFGELQTNPLTYPKLNLKSNAVRVHQLWCLEKLSQAAPGTIISINSSGLCVATGSTDVWISGLLTLEGNPVDPVVLAAQDGLQPGRQLPNLSIGEATQIKETLESLASCETFWHNRLALWQSFEMPYKTLPLKKDSQWVTTAWCESIEYCGMSPRSIVLGAFATYLARLTGQTQFQIGWKLKPLPDQKTLQDILALVVPMLCDIDCNKPFAKIVQRIEEEVQLLKEKKTYPRDVICRYPKLRALPELKSIKPWRVAVSMLDNPLDETTGGELLTLQIDSTGRFRWMYDVHCIETDVINRMSNHIRELVTSARANSDSCVAKLNLLPKAERELLINTWNDTKSDYPDKASVHQLFEQQVKRTPNLTAVIFKDKQLSYEQLNSCANELAQRLVELNVAPGDFVITLFERCIELIIAQLAILKVGAAYVPLNPESPHKRNAAIIDDCSARLLITDDRKTPFNIPTVHCTEITCDGMAIPNLNISSSNLDIAYVMYTSGSTGIPKGVVVTHQSICSLIVNNNFVVCKPNDRVAFVGNPAFDAATFEVWAPLLYGGAVVVFDRETALSTVNFCHTIQKERINIMFITVALFYQIFTALMDTFAQFDTLMVGGEILDPHTINTILSNKPPKRFLNVYGPTEATTFATMYVINGSVEVCDTIPIGKPMANTQIYLLDLYGQPVPQGVLGEIYIGGAGIARGYLNLPDMTAECFLPDPFATDRESRLYKTGDLARFLSDGNLVYNGRNDQQIKIRGFRIEVGEVEARLLEHPAVQQAVVIALGNKDKYLVSYMVVKDKMSAADLHDYLNHHLPAYMVPKAFVQLNELPLTLNGKIDFRALPKPDSDALARGYYEAPVGLIEIALAEIWSQLFGISRISRHDSFFALGGHSLLAMRLNSRIAALGIELPLSALYRSPTLAALAKEIQICQEAGAIILQPSVEVIPRGGSLPLSFAQQRLWFLTQIDSVSKAYNVPLGLHIKGSLDVCAWQKALDSLWVRHEAMRSIFISNDGQPEVRLLDYQQGLALRSIDLTEASQLEKICTTEAHFPFCLTSGPLVRSLLINVEPENHIFLLTQHHIIFDGWSINILLRELSALYGAYRNGEANPLSPLRIQYPDYAGWQRQWLSGERLERQSAFWKTALADAPLLLNLPTDRLRPSQQSFAGDFVPIELDRELSLQLKRLCHQNDVTLFMTILASWAVVLSRLSRQDEVVIGTPSANRGHPEIQPLIGFFVNMLALKVDLRGQLSVGELLARVKEIAVQAQVHQDLPFEQVVEIVQPPRQLNCTPIFQVIFAWHENDNENLDWPGLNVHPYKFTYDIAKFDLELNFAEVNDQIVGGLGYAIALFDRNTIERQANYLKTLLKAMTRDTNNIIHKIDILDSAERELLIKTWNNTQVSYPDQECVHQRFEKQVLQTPDAIAIAFREKQLSYAQLNQQANQLAHRLIQLNVSPGDYIVILLERSSELVVSQLAVLKAGAAYVPLDPQSPPERHAWIVHDCSARLIITDATKHSFNIPTLRFNEVDFDRMPSINPVLPCSSRNIAYIMYTSGSTGIPKGVLVPHKGIVRLVVNNTYAEMGPNSRVGSIASPAFDASTFEIWSALLNGGRLIVFDRETVLKPDIFCHALRKEGVDTLLLTPGLLNQILSVFVEVFPQLDTLIVGADMLEPRAINAVLRSVRPKRLINGYGPTESTVLATTHLISQVIDEHETIPIGRPIANTRTYLLDADCQPVPLGAVGELYIGGDGLAHGYLNRPDLTAERFLPDPFVDDPTARMYKTGDLARYRHDGNLEFHGRNDHQVKIRGFRIEPGEIEAKLINHPAVREAVVIAYGETDKRLIAYVISEKIEPSELRQYLSPYLPDYMMPAAFVQLKAIPLTSNGKLDRRALPAPNASAIARAKFEAPIGPVEVSLAKIWSDLLDIEQISRHDSFFALGGHSLLAVRLSSRIAALGGELPLAALFASPTLANLAAVIKSHEHSGSTVRPSIMPTPRDGALPLSFAQHRLWFLNQLGGATNAYNIPLVLRLTGLLDTRALQQALNTLWARHEALRSVFVNDNGEPEVRLLATEDGLPCREINLVNGTELGKICTNEAEFPFDLIEGPLIRAVLIRINHDDHMLLLTKHHIVSDGWSFGILMAELEALYSAFHNRKPNPLPPLEIQYPDYAAWQRQWLTSENMKEQANYWKTALADAPILLDLHTDRPRPAEQSFAGDNVPIELDADLTLSLKHLSQQHGVTLFMTLATAWAAVLSRLSSQDEIMIGTPSANRQQHEIENLIGFFVNTLVLRIDLRDHPSVATLLSRVKETTVQSQTHQDLPFEEVVEIVQPPRRLEYTPVFQVMFAWQTNQKQRWSLPDLDISLAKSTYRYVKFDLELNLAEDDGRIVGTLGYATALFNKSTIERHANYLQTMLRAMVENTNQPIDKINILDAFERELLLEKWNHTRIPYPEQLCLHHVIEQQANRTPNNVAIFFDGELVTYKQLNERANELAHRLIALGVQLEDRVAICVERSAMSMVGFLAILKAGGAYVPLDPMYRSQRLIDILTSADPTVVLVDSTGRQVLGDAALASRRVIDTNILNHSSCVNPIVPGLTSRHLAYIIYTSGSTGVPKGVMVEHRGLVNLAQDLVVRFQILPSSRILQFASFCFDASLFDVLMALTSGASLYIPSDEVRRDENLFFDYLKQNDLSHLGLPPALLQAWKSRFKDINSTTFVLSGEGVNAKLLQDMDDSNVMYNGYGPTENTICSTIWHYPSGYSGNIIPIGRPISNSRAYLLDCYGQPVPLGAVGELYLGGDSVARGYFKSPDVTAKSFVPDPFTSDPDSRMYKSGDLAYYLPDGNLVFVGRNDHQIKIRGFRIEPSEIEAKLLEHPSVREALVVTLEDMDKRLIAFIVGNKIKPSVLREYLSSQLPDFMLPCAFMKLDAFPVTVNGKIDRRALPKPDADAFLHAAYEAPIGPIETALAEIWQDLLGVNAVGRYDSFFALGGHSLLAIQVINRLRKKMLSLTIRDLFQTPVLMSLARTIDQHADVHVPPNQINSETSSITPALLPLIDLTQEDIDRIISCTPGGVANIQDIYSLSPLQDGILFLRLLTPSSDPYVITMQMAFAKHEKLMSYLAAVQEVINRHDILRTSFVWKGLSVPAQVVWRKAEPSITELEFDSKKGSIMECIQRLNSRRYLIDLTEAPLLQFVIAQDKTNDRWILLMLLHHLVGDHITLDILHAEIWAFLENRGDALPPAEPFRNLIGHVRLGISPKMHESFFREMLAEVTDPTLPFGVTGLYEDDWQINKAQRRLSGDLNQRLRKLAKRINVSLASLCHVAWAQVVSMCSNQARVVFGTVLFGRMQSGERSDQTMGLFMNTLPIYHCLDNTGVVESVRHIHARLAELLQHEYASLASAQRCSPLPGGTPLFSALLNYRHVEMDHSSKQATKREGIEFLNFQEWTSYPFVLSVDDLAVSLGITVQVKSPIQSERVCGYVEQALISLADALETAPNSPVKQLQILPTAERELLLHTWNNTKTPYTDQKCIHQLFEQQVARTPDAVAIVFNGEKLSYAQLNARANQLSHELVMHNVTLDTPVVICVERSPGMVVGIFAILKAGAAYVPLNPASPKELLKHVLTDVNSAVILADAVGRKALDKVLVTRTVLDPNAEFTQSQFNPQIPGLTSRHLAYVIYTSGSTGVPKGVQNEHRGVINYLEWMQHALPLTSKDRVLQKTPFTFDVSVQEFFWTLLSGAILVLAPPEMHKDFEGLATLIALEQVTAVHFVPSVLPLFLNVKQCTEFRHLKRITCSGETLSSTVVQLCQKKLPDTELINLYGPTEAAVNATAWLCPPHCTDSLIPIGRPISNTKIYLLNEHGQPVPLGAMGELYIGGMGVARGYLNRPDLSAERFVSDPFADDPNARMYKTGDLAQYLPDGNLIFLGRNDYQIKIRGFRIELGHIETILMKHPSVRDAVIIVCEEPYKRLIAYVVADEFEPLVLREYLSNYLPDYMLPSAFVRLDAMPLTSNQKLDRQALPALNATAFAHEAYEAPIGPIEIIVAEIWCDLIGVKHVSRHDSFFALGGHSLLAVQFMERLSRHDLSLSVRDLFQTPVLSALARKLGKHEEVHVPPNLITSETDSLNPSLLPLIDLTQHDINCIVARVPAGVSNIQDIYALSPLQEGILFHHMLNADNDPYWMMCQMAFENRDTLTRYVAAVQQVVNRHDIFRTAFIWTDLSVPAQVVWRNAVLSVTEVELDPNDGAIAEQLIQRFEHAQFQKDISEPPLLRFVYALDKRNNRWILQTLFHHLIGDHTTIDIMHAEVMSFLEGLRDDLPPAEPFRKLIGQTRLKSDFTAHERFFKKLLVDITEPTLPFGLADFPQNGSTIKESHQMLSAELNRKLRTQAKRLNVSLASLCHVAWAQVLSRTSGQIRVVFGTVLVGRMNLGKGSSRTTGLFINTLPIRVDLDETGVAESVHNTHMRLGELIEHEHASLVMAQGCSSVPAGTPLISSLLNYRHNAVPFDMNTLGITFLSSRSRTHYPFVLSVEDFEMSLGLTVQVQSPIDPDRVRRYMEQALTSLAEALEHTSDMSVWQLEILPEDERQLLIETWNDTKTPYRNESCIHQLFEEQVERSPNAPAIFCGKQQLSYAQLNEQANQLGRRLNQLNVTLNTRVIICVDNSPAMIIGILAVLKAGAAYVPLDPAYPGERLAHILADADPVVVLADKAGRKALGNALTARTVLDPSEKLTLSQTNLQIPYLNSSHLAYVIYTSGSTGVPKGVMIKHQSIVNYSLFAVQHYEVASGKGSLIASSISFDLVLTALFPTLIGGSSLRLYSNSGDSMVWHRAIFQASNLSPVKLTPSHLALLEENLLTVKSDKHVKSLVLGGEALNFAMLETWSRNAPSTRIFNEYGPTETTVGCVVYEIKQPIKGMELVPIGRPIANAQIYLLDVRGEPVPIGVVGEIYIAGDGVACGYHNRPELTAECFVHNPFVDDPDARMYKTGDLARYLPDGNLVYLGRNDHQLKIRGFRIEPGEIEARLIEYSGIREAVVVALEDKRLVAYVVADEIEPNSLRQYLSAHLPEYMIPSHFVRLDELPLTPNGKVDRRALPKPGTTRFSNVAYKAPLGPIERALAEIWSEILAVGQVSRDDSFFALGGHSLLAVKMVQRATSCGLPCTLNELFEQPILSNLAARMTSAWLGEDHNSAVPVRASGSEQPLFFVPTGLSDYSYVFSLARYIHTKHPIYALPWPSRNKYFTSNIETLAAKMMTSIKAVQPKGPYRIAGYSSGGILAYAIAKLLSRDDVVDFVGFIDTAPAQFSRNVSNKHLFAEFLTRSIDPKIFQDIEDLHKIIDEIDGDNLIMKIQEIGVLSSDLPLEFFSRSWERINHFSRAIKSYRPLPLPVIVHQFYATGIYTPQNPLDTNLENLSENNITSAWKKLYPDIHFHSVPSPGDHWTIINEVENQIFLGEAFSRALENLSDRSSKLSAHRQT